MRPARFLIALVLAASLLAVGGPVSADDPTRSSDPAVSEPSETGPAKSSLDRSPLLRGSALQKPRRYSPRPGVAFNSALGSRADRNRIFGKIIAAINHAPERSRIRVMSWNIMSRTAVDALLRAQARGVKVRVLMDNTNLVDIPNPGFKRLKAGFKHANQRMEIKPSRRSYAKTCIQSCRGARGAAHSKIYLFSKTGKAKDVVMSGSANLTVAGAINQWNDMYTWVGNRRLFNFASRVYAEMWKDVPVAEQFVQFSTGKDLLGFTPLIGPGGRTADPVQDLLSRVTCTGATGAGKNGRTIVRAAPDVMRNERGMAIARRLRELWIQGCDVRIAYTVMGVDVFRFLGTGTARGPVPKKHLVQDFDGDGEFDNYFHLKALTINGVFDGNPTSFVTLNGSSNWSGYAAVSDENFGILFRRSPTLKYQHFIDYWYENFPKNVPLDEGIDLSKVDRYANLDLD
ncbi:MAG TPA: phospholipase D-like domain-containing protein [Nocardioides sp.]|nr:phospholipase D-like domain-containing protein [Nocardioides sp.]